MEGWSEKDRIHLGEELSDVLLYLIRLAGTQYFWPLSPHIFI